MSSSPTLRQRKGHSSKTVATSTTTEPLLMAEDDNGKKVTKGMSTNSKKSDHDDGYVLIPLKERSMFGRLDVFPFIILYAIMIFLEVSVLNDGNNDGHNEGNQDNNNSLTTVFNYLIKTLGLPLLLLSHLFVVVLQQWKTNVMCQVGYYPCSSTEKGGATHCWVKEPITESLQHQSEEHSEIVPVTYHTEKTTEHDGNNDTTTITTTVAIVSFQDITFRSVINCDRVDPMDNIFSSSQTKEATSTTSSNYNFHKLKYPIDLPLNFYTNMWKGHANIKNILNVEEIYGKNQMDIKLPSFFSLLKYQLVAPFFLFQLLCVVLWSLDEYWYYALFTLFALIMFESTVAYNRLKSLQRLRSNTKHPYHVYTYRHNNWIIVKTNELLPGDLVSLTTGKGGALSHHQQQHQHTEQRHVPADILLLSGNAVIDEALLTGESIPQLKGPIESSSSSTSPEKKATSKQNSSDDDNEQVLTNLDMSDTQHKQSILFGGTILVSHQNNSNNTSSDNHENLHLHPPDNGIVGFVLRTGFDTLQGSLLRTMAHTSTSKKTVDGIHTRDTFVFVLLLLVCAIFSAVVVFLHGYGDETRNQFRLILHVIIIVTSVVPPELPMELSLCVTNSVHDLIKRCSVYCTEPYRIPWAGRIDYCCFDKTGTLTSDEMLLNCVRLPTTSSSNGGLIDTKPVTLKADDDNHDDDHSEAADKQQQRLPWHVLRIMVACHSLAPALTGGLSSSKKKRKKDSDKNNIIGDPLERAVLRDTPYSLESNNKLVRVDNDANNHHNPVDDSESSLIPEEIVIHHRFAFSSRLKRMTVLVTEKESTTASSTTAKQPIWSLSKGAPETMKKFFKKDTIPSNYDDISMHHMSRGQRVLSIGYRQVGFVPSNKISHLSTYVKETYSGRRDEVEKDIIFAGFLVLDCPLKSDSKSIINELRKSGHNVVMITGDAVLTATEVAKQVNIISTASSSNRALTKKKKSKTKDHVTYELRVMDPSSDDLWSKFAFVPLTNMPNDNDKKISLTKSNLAIMHGLVSRSEASFCLSGDSLVKVAMAAVSSGRNIRNKGNSNIPSIDPSTMEEKNVLLHPIAQDVLKDLVPVISVFARHAPRQKEAVVSAFNLGGHHTLMCGDGTNDVGALKRAHVGISIISAPEIEAKQRDANATLNKIKADHRREKKEQKKSKSKNGKTSSSRKAKANRSAALEESLRQLREAQEELDFVELGDASVASPFTSRAMSIRCCKDVLQQGRCTLVTMLQIYKILGVNSLVNALVLSKLHMHGVKQGDRQLTILGIVVAVLFLFVTRGKPLPTLSQHSPPTSVLCKQALLSIIIQFFIHFVFIMLTTHVSLSYVDPWDPSIIPDGSFNPNVLNSCTFLMTVLATINTFVVNYRGRPFMEDLSENKMLLRSVQVCYVALFACALEVFPPLNDLLQLTTLPQTTMIFSTSSGPDISDNSIIASLTEIITSFVGDVGFPTAMCLLMIADTVLCYGAEKCIVQIFEG